MNDLLTPSYTANLSRKLDETFTQIQSNREVLIPSSVRSFFESIIIESYNFRLKEWKDALGFDIEDDNAFDESAIYASNAVRHILTESASELSEEGESLNYISLISVLQEINAKWCDIFPFCR